MSRRRRSRFHGFGAVVTDDAGLAVRCFEEKGAAFRWLDKHSPGLDPAEKRRRVWTFGSRRQVSDFFARQIQAGCADAEVLALLTYWCGVSTERGFDLKAGRIRRAKDGAPSAA